MSRTSTGFPVIMELKEKHENQYFIVTSEAHLHQIALEILTTRLKVGYFYDDPTEDKPLNLDFTEEQVNQMPEGFIRTEALAKLIHHRRVLKRWENEVKDFQLIQLAIANKDGKIAWMILSQIRHDAEYESIRLVYPCKVGSYNC